MEIDHAVHSDYSLFVPRSLDFEEGVFVCAAHVLRGANVAGERTTLRLARPVTVCRAYLASQDLDRVLDLHPLVVETCPTCEDDEVFLYESASAERAHYVSFQKGHALASPAHFAAVEKAGLTGGRRG